MAAPIGNLFALGNNGGAPAFYDSVDKFLNRTVEYFESFISDEEKGLNPVLGRKPTTTGLALWLGFASRQSLYDYKEKKEFSDIIKKALLFIEMSYEEQLDSKNAGGAIFALTNMKWRNKMYNENNNNHSGEVTITRVIKK